MVEIRPATYDDAEPVVELLYSKMSSKVPRERWRRLFDYSWRPADVPDFGRVLDDGGHIVGFLGATYVDRRLDGQTRRICNMSSWYFDKPYRGRGLGRAMMADLTANPQHLYTDLTATAAVERMLLTHLAFYVLDRQRVVIEQDGGPAPVADEALAQDALIQHHAGLGVRVVEACGCRLILQVKRKGADIDYHDVLYASDRELLAAHAQEIANAILPGTPSVLAIDRRLLPNLPHGGRLESIAQPRLAKGTVDPALLDNLYNEILLLDLKFP